MRTRNWLSRCFLKEPMACKDTVVWLGHFLIFPHRFRWVYCQLDVLRQCFPSSVRGVLAELPESLDETYERILQQIPNPNRAHTHRLLQCLVVAAYPLRVEELAEVLAIDFSATGMTPKLDENLRCEDKERAVLSACSSLITIVRDDWGSRFVQFSHFSVKEFLTSDRLAASTLDTLRYHHIRLEPAHTMMAQVCLSVLLQLESDMDKRATRSYPLSQYAGKQFGSHVEFENVISSINDGVDNLLDRDKPHFYIWVWLQIGDWDEEKWHNSKTMASSRSFVRPTPRLRSINDMKPKHPPRLPPLYYVAALGHLCLTRHLILKCPQDLDVRDDKGCTPLHIAMLAGKEGVSQLLIEHSVDLDIQDINDRTPLHMVAYMGLAKATQMLLERGEGLKARLNARDKNGRTPLHMASQRGHSGIAELLLKFGADVDAEDNNTMTPLLLVLQHWGPVGDASQTQITKAAQLLLEHGASVHVRNKYGHMPLHGASHHGLSGIVALLLKLGADVDAQDNDAMTPLLSVSQHEIPFGDASQTEITKTAQLLLEHGASVHVRNKHGQMPLHGASRHGFSGIVALLLKLGADVDAQDNDAMTPLLLVSQHPGPFGDAFQTPITKTAQLLLEHGASVHVRNKHGQMPLHGASHNGLSGIVALLLKLGADVDAQDNDAMTPLLLASQQPCPFGDASQTEITETAQLLLEHGASVHVRDKNGQMPLHRASHHGLSGIVALLLKLGADVDSQDNDAMTPLLLVSQQPCHFGDASQTEITKTAQLLLEHGASVHVRNKHGQMPLHGASRHGFSSIVELLLKLGADVDAQDNNAMTPLLLVSQQPCHFGDASQTEITKTAQLLLEHGASVHVRNKNGQMPLHGASNHGHPGIVAVLLKFGADVDAQDNSSITPLHFAVSSPFHRELFVSRFNHTPSLRSVIETIELLLDQGANLQMQNDKGETPLQVASKRGEQKIIDVLSDYVKNDPGDVACNIASVPSETTYRSTEGSSPFLSLPAISYPSIERYLHD